MPTKSKTVEENPLVYTIAVDLKLPKVLTVAEVVLVSDEFESVTLSLSAQVIAIV